MDNINDIAKLHKQLMDQANETDDFMLAMTKISEALDLFSNAYRFGYILMRDGSVEEIGYDQCAPFVQ